MYGLNEFETKRLENKSKEMLKTIESNFSNYLKREIPMLPVGKAPKAKGSK